MPYLRLLGNLFEYFRNGPQSLSLSDLKMIRWLPKAKAKDDHEPWPIVDHGPLL